MFLYHHKIFYHSEILSSLIIFLLSMSSLPWLVFIYLFIWQLQWRSYSILSKKTVSPLLMYFQEWIGEDKSFCGCYQLDTRRKRFTKDKSKSVTLVVQLCSKRWELSNTKTLLRDISTISCREKATANTYQTGKHYN